MAVEHTAAVTKVVNEINFFVGDPASIVLDAVGAHYDPHLPIPNHVAVTWVIMVGLGLWGLWYRRRIKQKPSGLQNFLELFIEMMYGLCDEVIGPKGRKYFTLLAGQAIYIAIASAIGLIPFFMAPTASLNTTVALAVVVFIYYNWEGIREQGLLSYLAHFSGPPGLPWYMFPIRLLLFPIEIVSHLARPLSLSVRLFANIFGDEVILAILLMLVGFVIIPVQPLMFLAIFKAVVQAYIFFMLTAVYLAGAVAEEDH